jgi:helicase
MKMTALLKQGLSPEIISLWRACQGESLLPLQASAVRDGLFAPGNLLIQAPTSSGKTFVGEMAAVQAALDRKQVIYLAPLKALAEEKFHEFQRRYAAQGLKVIISTRDHRSDDAALESGDFSIAVVVYEKLAQLLVRRPERLEQIGLVIADELEILSDPERGALVELLLTRVLHARCRLIGLSAVVGEAERLAVWMQARLVQHKRRPLELRYGVYFDGTFRYRAYNEASKGEEALAPGEGLPLGEALQENIALLAGRGESCLVFVKAKHESRRWAEGLAANLTLPAAREAIEALRPLERTRSRAALLRTLGVGVAFHNADLAPAERRIVEEGYRTGEIRVLVSTSTLATGLNLPAQNVFISPEKWRYDTRLDMPWKAPILRGEYENMGGRAGRFGAGLPFGRSILIATTAQERDALWTRYVDGAREPIQPRLAEDVLEDHIVRLVASRSCRTLGALVALLESSLSGQWVWAERYTLEEIETRIRAAVNRCVDVGALTTTGEGLLDATPLGKALAAKGVRIESAQQLERWLAACETRPWSDVDLLLAAALTSDGRLLSLLLTTQEYEGADYLEQLKHLVRNEPGRGDTPLNRIAAASTRPTFEEFRAIKGALIAQAWIDEAALPDIEESYNTMAGQVLSIAEQLSWLADTAASLGEALGAHPAFVERLQALCARVQFGVCAEVLPLARLEIPGLDRGALLALHEAGLHTRDAIAQCAFAALRRHVGGPAAEALKAWSGGEAQPIPAAAITRLPARLSTAA